MAIIIKTDNPKELLNTALDKLEGINEEQCTYKLRYDPRRKCFWSFRPIYGGYHGECNADSVNDYFLKPVCKDDILILCGVKNDGCSVTYHTYYTIHERLLWFFMHYMDKVIDSVEITLNPHPEYDEANSN